MYNGLASCHCVLGAAAWAAKPGSAASSFSETNLRGFKLIELRVREAGLRSSGLGAWGWRETPSLRAAGGRRRALALNSAATLACFWPGRSMQEFANGA